MNSPKQSKPKARLPRGFRDRGAAEIMAEQKMLATIRAIYESYTLDPLCQAVEQAWKNGIVVVVAAGNNGRYLPTEGYGTITSPGNDPYVITVGAMKPMGTPTRTDDLIASYSSKGPTVIDAIAKPDLVAPGNLLVSLEDPAGYVLTPLGRELVDRFLPLVAWSERWAKATRAR